MMLPDIAEYLIAQGIQSGGFTVKYGYMPETPDQIVTIYEYQGLMDEPKLGKGTTNLENPRINVVVRGTANDYDIARQKGQDVKTAMARVVNMAIAVSNVRYLTIQHLNGPAFMRRDANFRTLFTSNYQVEKEYEA